MFLQWIWLAMMLASVVFACFQGNAGVVLTSALAGMEDAISLIVNLGAGYLLFCGLIELMKAAGAAEALNRMLAPLLRRLMPGVRGEDTRRAISMNLSANMLGLGNAATPMGMEAMRLMERECAQTPAVRHDMYMLLIVNATSIQLIPTTVLSLRAAAGSAAPERVLLPGLACSALATVVGVALGRLCRGMQERRHG